MRVRERERKRKEYDIDVNRGWWFQKAGGKKSKQVTVPTDQFLNKAKKAILHYRNNIFSSTCKKKNKTPSLHTIG